ncbi:NAD(P) transhydrogenase subunit alpha [Aureliella helgolandensis]|uniref:proton-translocating NAD(P)(+) transhydrogenase n=2 Tax=Aureliella helgolandensis TaxID=2527968 RepID=A0A518G8G1_9BACT|nr:NAD(P) transhydrogenase subunit alpha [Aureliella helgolandensis]QDV24875.1 NAD(P) transhydrogenase subunit alpha [Aureliella helgolandensis]
MLHKRIVPVCFLVLLCLGGVPLLRPVSGQSTSEKPGAVDSQAREGGPAEAEESSLSTEVLTETTGSAASVGAADPNMRMVSKTAILVGSLTVFLLAVFVGFEVITKVPPTLHTPLMSGSNAISGITVVGAILTAGHSLGGFGAILGMLAVVLAMVNVVGGFLVTHRMLKMFKKR